MGQLDGKVAVITGASRGLGKTILSLFKQEGATTINLSRSNGFDLLPIDYEGRLANLKQVDILVNNAAMQGPVGDLGDNDWHHWQDTIGLNLLAPVALCRWAIRRGVTKIVNISGGGAAGSRPQYTAYASSKAALVRFSECLADEYSGIDVNCVAPGQIGPMDGEHTGYEEEMRLAAELVLVLSVLPIGKVTGRLISSQWDSWKHPGFTSGMTDKDLYTLRRKIQP